ncbi:hypothetical protein J3L18_25695 [Mucilaginibacter gossypii]|uniref:hypothetical protein n=1 Tax=Mucilaginibacter gossypii TaxID=551996 RepID=UPI000DCAE338|nr:MULTISPECIES: hypothetical protein [Mucilaginibacter]QTE36492.1 hypothetical protein J3L18_25695 [Mucilaginibacter gossypii]RAV48652.1 hypothetical protein DIU36_28125 [Mucilaginibacter rubeus]
MTFNPTRVFQLLGILLAATIYGAYGQTVASSTQVTKTVTKTATGTFTTSSPAITMDLSLHAFSDVLPFDVPFQIIGGGAATDPITIDQVQAIDCWYGPKLKNVDLETLMQDPKQLGHHTSWFYKAGDKQFSLMIEEGLPPNKVFTFIFRMRRKLSDAQKTTLVTTAKPFITEAIAQAANGGSHEFSDVTFDKIIGQIEQKTADAVEAQGLKIDFAAIDAAHHKILFDALGVICTAYEQSSQSKKALDGKIAQLKVLVEKLKTFELAYERTIADPDNNADVKALRKVFPLAPPAWRYPTGANAVDDGQVTAYLGACKALADALQPILPDNPDLKPIKKGIIEDFLPGITDKFKQYSLDLKTIDQDVAAQSLTFTTVLAERLYSNAYITGTSTPGDFTTRANLYISADLGLAVIPQIGQLAPYLGTNIYLRPVNKNYPLTFHKLDFFKRFSFLIGLTVNSLAKDNYRADLLGSFNLITGGGFRVADFVRINGGMVWYGQINPNPLNSNKSIAGSPFISLSFDINVKTVFNNLFTSSQVSSIQ